jgi:hypothetical protein
MSDKTRPGFRPKYCKAIVDRICRYIATGLNNKQACQAAGISETSLLVWRKQHAGFAEKVEAAREIMRSKILAKIKAAGKDDWRAHVEFLRLAFAEYRFGNSQTVNVAVQSNMEVYDPARAELIERRNKALEAARARALANKDGASEPKQLADGASDAREEALAAERQLQLPPPPAVVPKHLQEKPPKNIVEHCDLQAERMRREGWRAVDSELDD